MMKSKILIGVPSVLLGLTALVGVLHMPFARPVLALIGYGCPIKASPGDVEVARRLSAKAIRGTTASPSRPALGFALDRSTRADVDVWVESFKLDCDDQQEGAVLRCKNVPASAFGENGALINDVAFAFEPRTLKLV